MYPEAISPETGDILAKLSRTEIANNFYLAGGTALSLQLGHRKSIDLDWFSKADFSGADLKKELASLGNFELNSEAPGTINGLLDNVRLSFFHYDYDLIFPFIIFQNVNLADERDIAAMKISAISYRGRKKDFIDLYFLLQKYSLKELIGFFEKKFKDIKYNNLHILKSLAYFEDAEEEPMPIILKPAGWEEVKERIRKAANDFLKN